MDVSALSKIPCCSNSCEKPGPYSPKLIDQSSTDTISSCSPSSFNDLPCTEEDRAKIRFIITGIATEKKSKLFSQRAIYEAKGKELKPVHCLKFLSVILSTPDLKEHLKTLFNKTIVKAPERWEFLKGLTDSFKEEIVKGNFYNYLPEFANAINVPYEEITPYVQKNQLDEMVKFLAFYPG